MSAPEDKAQGDKPQGGSLLEHEYDGIVEYDNPLPGWWVWSFWASFFFSIGYLFHYWAGNGVSVGDSYEEEMAVVRAERAQQALAQAVTEESLQEVLADQVSLTEGAGVYASRCAPCHAEQGQGLIGPNLTDSHWIHGRGQLMDIYEVVAQGVLEKGMPAWDRQLTPAELRRVVAYVGSIRGSNVPGKAPEGAPVE